MGEAAPVGKQARLESGKHQAGAAQVHELSATGCGNTQRGWRIRCQKEMCCLVFVDAKQGRCGFRQPFALLGAIQLAQVSQIRCQQCLAVGIEDDEPRFGRMQGLFKPGMIRPAFAAAVQGQPGENVSATAQLGAHGNAVPPAIRRGLYRKR